MNTFDKLRQERTEILGKIEEMKRTQKAESATIAAGPASNDDKKEAARLGQAVATANYILPARIKALEDQLEDVETQLQRWLEASIRGYNNFVRSKVKEAREAFIKAVNPFFGGPEKESLTRREFAMMHIPLVAELDRAGWFGDTKSFGWGADLVSTAQTFLDRRQEMALKYGWGDPEKADAADVSRPAAVEEAPRKVKVKAKQDCTMEALDYATGTDKRGRAKPIKEGQVIEIWESDYRALARHFEPG